nr:PREDICTED: X-ray repair cross-complementing protein 6-like [Bemisia tabaci]
MDNSLQWNITDSLDNGNVEDSNYVDWMYGRIGIVFLIECTPAMFMKAEDRSESFFQLSLTAVRELIRRKIRACSKDSIGVVFYGTVKQDKSTNPNAITTFLEVREPSPDSILKIDEVVNLSKAEFENRYGFSQDYSIGDGLWHCSSMLRSCGFKFRAKSIMLATCNDDPFSVSPNKQHQVRKRAEDLHKDNVDLQLLPFGQTFDITKFYEEILQMSSDHQVSIPKNIECQDDLLAQVLFSDYKPRTFGHMKFFLNKNVAFAVSAYKLYRKETLPTASKVDRMHNKPVKTVTTFHDADTDNLMFRSELAKQVTLADAKVQVSELELKEHKALTGKFGFQLLGFKPSSAVKFYHHSQSSLYIIPAEKMVKGSEVLFVTLRDCLLEQDKVAVCYLTTRRTASPKLVYLIPQKEQILNGLQVQSDGFHVVFLPFAEQFRKDIPLNDVPEVPPDLENVAERMVKKLKLTYSPTMFHNPKLETFWAGLEALALNQDEVVPIDDLSNPDPDSISQRLKGISEELKHFMNNALGPTKTSQKRPASASKQPVKKMK